MTKDEETPGLADHAVSAISMWFGDHLANSGNGLHTPLSFYRSNRPVDPGLLEPGPTGKIAVFLHGLGCNEALWSYPAAWPGGGYGDELEARLGFLPLYVRYNSGLAIPSNGHALHQLLDTWFTRHGDAVSELVLIGHSMGGLVIRSACSSGAAHPWTRAVRHVFYLGSPHLGAPLERTAKITSTILGALNTTASRVVRDVLDSRSEGVKDLHDGLGTQIPWLPGARHHQVVGEVIAGLGMVGDGVVQTHSASAASWDPLDTTVMAGLDHLALARHPRVLDHIVERLTDGPA